jgi:hypothetical protein
MPVTDYVPSMIAPAILLAISLQQPPPAGYWQQRLDYRIEARLDEDRGTLSGTQQVRYHNNSPDTLRTVAFHLYLNAFRPGSRWADADSMEGRRRFNDLRDPDYAFNRVSEVTIGGLPVEPVYPFAPDSTIVRFALPRPVAPGDSFAVSMRWSARPSTLPRRQGRRERHYDFAQWYPRVVAYDRYGWAEHPLYPAGEFYGDFGDFRVTLDLPEDQVIGATGVPACGDPGWSGANANPAQPVALGRDAYGAPVCETGSPAPGRKQVVFDARDVHHFAISMNPDYRYEGGRYGNVLVHVLYQPGDTATWGGGIAVERTRVALEWLDRLFGPYAWPQITNVHRIEAGGTEFPMMVHNGSASQGLIVHEVGHNYLMGVLANNEWREGFLDEGFSSFQTRWFNEAADSTDAVRTLERNILLLDLDGWSQPTSLVSERYRDFSTYNAMISNRGELFFHQLRRIVGDATMREILRAYYQRWKLRHVDEMAFRVVAEEVSGRDLGAFFGQWLHGTELYDYSIGGVRTQPRNGATTPGWVSRVEVVRKAPGMFPVEVVVRSGSDSARARVSGAAASEWVELVTEGRPREVEVDPDVLSHDWNMLNNRKKRGLFGFAAAPRREVYLDRLFSRRIRRDGVSAAVTPTVWYNDEGGVTLGGRVRTDYLGRFEQSELMLSLDTRGRDEREGSLGGFGGYLKVRNPVRLQMPRTAQTLEAYWVEGRAGLAIAAERQTNAHRTVGPRTWRGGSLRWLVTTETEYLDPALWDGGGTVEAESWLRSEERRGRWTLSGRLGGGGGVEYRNRGGGLSTGTSYDIQPYLRLTAEASARRELGGRASVAIRGYAGWVESGRRPLKQRQLFVSGADPYREFGNPFLRSRGALLSGNDVHYHMPGGGGVRGLQPGISSTRLLAINVEADRAVLMRDDPDSTSGRGMRLFRDVRIAGFGDAALGNGDIPLTGSGASLVADAGLGIRIRHRIAQTSFVTRFDAPFLVTRPRLAVDDQAGSVRFRVIVSFSPALP